MKPFHLIAGAVLAAAGFVAPSISMAAIDADFDIMITAKGSAIAAAEDSEKFANRGRGHGGARDRGDDHRRDRSNDDDSRRDRSNESPSRNDDSPSGRSRPRIPGGSGCDDPGDLIEHPECRG